MAGLVAIVVLSSLVAGLLATPAAGQAPATAGLEGLRRVAIEVTLAPDHPGVIPEELERRLDATLRAGQPAPRIDPESPDVLRLTVSVHQVSATELRGYYLPFSGRYGLGSVRLAVVRPVALPGVAAPVAAVVWQAERLARAPWGRSGTEIAGLLDELVSAFLEDYRQAVGRTPTRSDRFPGNARLDEGPAPRVGSRRQSGARVRGGGPMAALRPIPTSSVSGSVPVTT